MVTCFNQIMLSAGVLLALSTCASAFFFGSWSTETETPAPPQYYYHKRLLQGPVPVYAVNNLQDPQAIPAIPMAMPLQANLAPSAIQNVQLVPCLCPVQQDYGYDVQHQDNVYVNPYQQPAQPPPQPQQKPKQTRRK